MQEVTFDAKNPFFISLPLTVCHSHMLLQKQGLSLWKERQAGHVNMVQPDKCVLRTVEQSALVLPYPGKRPNEGPAYISCLV